MANNGFSTVFINFGRENKFFDLSRLLKIITGSPSSLSAFFADRKRAQSMAQRLVAFRFTFSYINVVSAKL